MSTTVTCNALGFFENRASAEENSSSVSANKEQRGPKLLKVADQYGVDQLTTLESLNQSAAPGGNRAQAQEYFKQDVATLLPKPPVRKAKTSRTRYVRLFPERLFYAIALLKDDWKVCAWLRFLAAYTRTDGRLPANDKDMATATRTGKRWLQFRDTLLELDLARIEDGYWIDADQDASLRIQRNASDRARQANKVRWGERHA